MVLNSEIHKKVFIYVYLQFKSELKENYLALTSLKIPLILENKLGNRSLLWSIVHGAMFIEININFRSGHLVFVSTLVESELFRIV